ncbi:MAG: universal stress protein [Opitutus sp.]
MNTVLAAIDFSPVSHEVVRTAVELKRAIAGRMVVLHVVQPPLIATDLGAVLGEVVQLNAEVERHSRRRLRDIQKRLARRGETVETACCQGSSVVQIIARAEELGARYIVLGSHGHTAFYDLVAGSTTSGVMKRSPCPVVIVPAAPKKIRQEKSAARRHRREKIVRELSSPRKAADRWATKTEPTVPGPRIVSNQSKSGRRSSG